MYKMLFIARLVLILSSNFLHAQNLVPLKLEVVRQPPGSEYPETKLSLEYWLQIDQDFIALMDEESTISLFQDDLGTDMIKHHRKAVQAWEAHLKEQEEKGRYIFSSRPQKLLLVEQAATLKDTTGFKFSLNSWALPHPKSTTLQLKGKLVYLVTHPNTEEKNISIACQGLGRETEVEILGKSIKISESGSSSYGDEHFISYTLPREDVPVALSKVEVYNASKELVSGSPFGGGDSYNISVKQAYSNQAVTLKFYFREVERKEYILNQQISLGL